MVESFALKGDRRTLDAVRCPCGSIAAGGWCCAPGTRAPIPACSTCYPYGTTSPVYLDLPGKPATAADGCRLFRRLAGPRLEAARARDDFNDEGERKATLDYLSSARARFVALQHHRETSAMKFHCGLTMNARIAAR